MENKLRSCLTTLLNLVEKRREGLVHGKGFLNLQRGRGDKNLKNFCGHPEKVGRVSNGRR